MSGMTVTPGVVAILVLSAVAGACAMAAVTDWLNGHATWIAFAVASAALLAPAVWWLWP